MSIFSIFKPSTDAFTLGRQIAMNLVATSPFEDLPQFDRNRTIQHFLLLQLFFAKFAAMQRFGDEGPGERLQHGLTFGFTQQYPHLAPEIGIQILGYARIFDDGANEESTRQLVRSYLTNAGVPHEFMFEMHAMNVIATVGVGMRNVLSELAEKTRLT